MLRKIRSYFKGKKELIDSFHDNASYMSVGTYVFDDSINYLVMDEPGTKKRTFELLQRDYYRKSFIRLFVYVMRNTLFRGSIMNQPEDGMVDNFSGTVFLPVGSSNGYKDKKIFDLVQKKVLTLFGEKADFMSVLSNYEYFNDFFQLAKIVWSDEKKLLIMEELIISVPKNTWKMDDYLFVMVDVFECYFDYLSFCYSKHKFNQVTVNEIVISLPDDPEITYIGNQINNELLHMKIPKIKLHGDLWSANTLLTKADKKQITYIDWEFSRELPFFYDFFNMMWLEFYMYNNDLYIKKYVNGEFDRPFIKIFALFDIPFKSEYRLAYFAIYFLIFYKERLILFEAKDRLTYIDQYKRLMEKNFSEEKVLITS
jgi:thiamine kinase-like enzyme